MVDSPLEDSVQCFVQLVVLVPALGRPPAGRDPNA
jgi:hypothetical protein